MMETSSRKHPAETSRVIYSSNITYFKVMNKMSLQRNEMGGKIAAPKYSLYYRKT